MERSLDLEKRSLEMATFIKHKNKEELHDGRSAIDIQEIKIVASSETYGSKNGKLATESSRISQELSTAKKTTYFGSLMHLLKGNVGTGIFASGDAVKNSGLIPGTFLTVILAITCLHGQKILINCSKKMQIKYNRVTCPSFAETVELCFLSGPPSTRPWAKAMGKTVNIFICVTQLGFCSIYFVFISDSLQQLLQYYGININTRICMAMILLPILLTCMVPNLKSLVPVSVLGTICLFGGMIMVLYYSFQGLPPLSERKAFATWAQMPLYFGTVIYGFESIAFVLPLRSAMKKPEKFDTLFGVLNVGMTIYISVFIFFGFIGYWRYGEDVKGNMALNLPEDQVLAQIVKAATALGVLLTYAIQFYIPIEVIWPQAVKIFRIDSNFLSKELALRASFVVLTFAIAEVVPNLALLISLLGALCSSALALLYPPLIQIILKLETNEKLNLGLLMKNSFIMLLGLLGFCTGLYASTDAIIKSFK